MKKLFADASRVAAAFALSAQAARPGQPGELRQDGQERPRRIHADRHAPARTARRAQQDVVGGTFEFARPNRFRFNYNKPFEQTIVADGQTLWLYDADLNQVTPRKQSRGAGRHAGRADRLGARPEALRKDFDLEARRRKDGLEWVQATPKAKEGQLHMREDRLPGQ